jgi:hypothetical protein
VLLVLLVELVVVVVVVVVGHSLGKKEATLSRVVNE